MCKIECWTTSKCVQLAKSCPWAAKTDLTCYIKLDLNVLVLRSASGAKYKMQIQNTKYKYKTDLTCYIKLDLNVQRQAPALRSARSILAHYCTIYPCNLGTWKSLTINAETQWTRQRLSSWSINYKWSKIRNAKTKYEVKIQMLWSMAGWKSMDLGFLPETSQTTVLSFV